MGIIKIFQGLYLVSVANFWGHKTQHSLLAGSRKILNIEDAQQEKWSVN